MFSLRNGFSLTAIAAAIALLAGAARADSILFVGNSFTYAAYAPVWRIAPTASTI
jgi:hypothetical protein